MAAAWYLARSELRQTWRSLVLLVLLIGLSGGVVLTAVTGARRSDTAYDRFRATTLAYDLDIVFDGPPDDLDPATVAALAALPQVAAMTRTAFPFIVPAGSGLYPYIDFLAVAPQDAAFGTTIDRPRMLEGRPPAPGAADEAAVLDRYATDTGVRVGDRLTFDAYAPDQLEPLFTTGDAGPPAGPPVTVRVTGIFDAPVFLSDSIGSFQPNLILSKAFSERHADDVAAYSGGFTLRLRRGAADVPAVSAAARELFADQASLELVPAAEVDVRIRDALDVVVVALLLTAAVASVAGALATTQAFSRQLDRSGSGRRWLHALGMTRRERVLALAGGLGPGVVGGAVLAVGLAVLASPLMPVGAARRADPDPGLSVDGWALAVGFLGIVVALSVVALLVALPASRRPAASGTRDATRPTSRAMGMLRRSPLGPAATVGTGMALDPRDGTSWSVRAALGGTTFSVAGLAVAVILGSSLGALLDSPARYGSPWDATVPGFGGEIVDQLRGPLQEDPDVAGLSVLSTSLVLVEGMETNVHAVERVTGAVSLTVLSGRAPQRSGEAVLGTTTLRDSDLRVGDLVEIEGASERRMRVVGRAAFPVVDERSDAGRGAWLWPEDLEAVSPEGSLNHDLIIQWGPGVDPAAANARLAGEAEVEVVPPRLPADVNNLREVEALPQTLAVLLAVLAALALLHALVATTRSRRRDLAVLRTLGFQRRQLAATIAWQASTIALGGLVLGGVLGVVLGRLTWAGIAGRVGVVEDPSVPVITLVAVGAAALVVGNLAGTLPARRAARVRPGVVLRAD